MSNVKCKAEELQDKIRVIEDDATTTTREMTDLEEQVIALKDAFLEFLLYVGPDLRGDIIHRLRTLEREYPLSPDHGYRRTLSDMCDRALARDY